MTTLTNDELRARVDAIFTDLFEIKAERLKPDARLFTDLALDSLDAIDLVVSFERQFAIRPPHSEIREIRTLADVHALVRKYYAEATLAKAN